jgi:hypothetical protein
MFRTVAACAALVAFAALVTVNAQVQPSPVAPFAGQAHHPAKGGLVWHQSRAHLRDCRDRPGFQAGRHFHPGVAMALVVEGEFWFQLDGQPEKVLRAGESLTTPDRAIHNEGALGQTVKLTAVYVVEKGKPLVSPAQ